MWRVTQIINNLETAGAEMTLLRLMERVDRDRFEPTVISLMGEGTLGPALSKLGIRVCALGGKRGKISVSCLMRLRRELGTIKPDLIQSWMYHSNLAASLARSAAPSRPPVVWNIRHSLHDLRHEPWLTRRVIRAGARLSRRASAIIANSAISLKQHEAIGYRSTRHEWIPNGLDLQAIQRVEGAGRALRRELGVSEHDLLIGSVARYHVMKGHRLLAEAVRGLEDLNAHLVLVGRGCEAGGEAESLRALLGRRLHLLGERRPVAPVLSGLDGMVVASLWGEGFPNVLAEAMACETPCISTDVGDAAEILGDPARMVAPSDVRAMNQTLRSLLSASESQRRNEGAAGRQRIAAKFQIGEMVEHYESLWESVICATER